MLDLVQILEVTCQDTDLAKVLDFIKSIMQLICLIIPVALIVFGSIDLGKAVIASDEKEIKGATTKLIKRAVAAVVVFFIPTIVSLLMRLLPQDLAVANCWNSKANDTTQGTYIVR